ncbi:MAG: hypothetical protein C0458_17580 [Methylobacterium sp.]|nr:hypothetical protein [Methylobacterium sp.]
MTKKNEGGRSLAPRNSKAIDEPADTSLRDPIAVAMEVAAGDDPSVAELVALRRQPLDLKNAARNAKNLHSEEFRVWLARESGDDIGEAVCGGLEIMSISLIALVALWPADDLDAAEAKLALDQRTGVQLHKREKDFESGLEAQTARRIRWRRGAFAVPALILPPAPVAPQSDDRGLSSWPLERFDLVEHLPKRGGPPAFAHTQVVEWSRFARSAPDLDALLQRANKMFETCDRLLELAGRGPGNASELLTAAEGARLMGYLAACQVMIWPIHNRDALATKKQVVALINRRGEVGDPASMQSAVRHVTAESAWIKTLPYDARDRLTFDWNELV